MCVDCKLQWAGFPLREARSTVATAWRIGRLAESPSALRAVAGEPLLRPSPQHTDSEHDHSGHQHYGLRSTQAKYTGHQHSTIMAWGARKGHPISSHRLQIWRNETARPATTAVPWINSQRLIGCLGGFEFGAPQLGCSAPLVGSIIGFLLSFLRGATPADREKARWLAGFFDFRLAAVWPQKEAIQR